MATRTQQRLTPEEYLALDREADRRSEYLNGEMFVMAGASPRHVLITSNIVGELRAVLTDRPCLVFSSDLRLKIEATGLYTYPDVMVACGEMRFADDQGDTLLNPCLVVEVLSKSTGNYDRGEKFAHYRSVKSVEDYLLVSQKRCHVELYSRQTDGRWVFSELDQLDDSVVLKSVDCRLKLREIYAKLELLPV